MRVRRKFWGTEREPSSPFPPNQRASLECHSVSWDRKLIAMILDPGYIASLSSAEVERSWSLILCISNPHPGGSSQPIEDRHGPPITPRRTGYNRCERQQHRPSLIEGNSPAVRLGCVQAAVAKVQITRTREHSITPTQSPTGTMLETPQYEEFDPRFPIYCSLCGLVRPHSWGILMRIHGGPRRWFAPIRNDLKVID